MRLECPAERGQAVLVVRGDVLGDQGGPGPALEGEGARRLPGHDCLVEPLICGDQLVPARRDGRLRLSSRDPRLPWGTTTTGTGAEAHRREATEPSRADRSGPWPRDPATRMAEGSSAAALARRCAGSPISQRNLTESSVSTSSTARCTISRAA